MYDRYDPFTIEPRWQQHWEDKGLFRAGGRTGPRKYVLEMFPYPSGEMHMGHVRCYTIGDVIARAARMRGHDVLHPIGFDALGLPAENAAIKEKVHPSERTARNIRTFTADLKSLGYSYDWSRVLRTSDPEYYRWNQWFFIKFYERGLVYRRQQRANWCTGCHTVLANEQVVDGTCERCGSKVIEKEIPEWTFRITKYADRLLEDLSLLSAWPERVTTMQRNWLGRSEGAEVDFPLEGRSDALRIFTTRADTIYGATYMVVAPEHPLTMALASADRRAEVAAFVERMKALTREERTELGATKEGVSTGAYAKNPFSGERIPVWTANFVLADYGTGAIMSVPAHDQRDYEFAKKYGIAIREVIKPAGGEPPADRAFTEDGVMVNSGAHTGLASADGRRAVAEDAHKRGIGRAAVQWHLRDWGFSRQRYWGTPIPIVYCERDGTVLVPEAELPVRLPEIDVAEVLTGRGEPPLAKVPSFVNTTCPRCGDPARREVETMDTFVDSCWYYARYLSPHDATAPFARAEADRWLPVDTYVGGPEHAVLHLLYFRFWHKVMGELGLVASPEPATRLITQGIVKGRDGEKMSKSRGNVVSPRDIVKQFGADTARLFILFAGPPEKDMDWSDEQVEGLYRFLGRVWRAYVKQAPRVGTSNSAYGLPAAGYDGQALALRRMTHRTIARVTHDTFDRLQFNTAIAALMELVNELTSFEPIGGRQYEALRESLEVLALCLSPFAPHIAEECWHGIGRTEELALHAWPDADPALVAEEEVTVAVQVNGKLRGEVRVPVDASQDLVQERALALDRVKSHLDGKAIRKVVYVPKRLMNLVVG
jgi:leucyl-tRNA synthetase